MPLYSWVSSSCCQALIFTRIIFRLPIVRLNVFYHCEKHVLPNDFGRAISEKVHFTIHVLFSIQFRNLLLSSLCHRLVLGNIKKYATTWVSRQLSKTTQFISSASNIINGELAFRHFPDLFDIKCLMQGKKSCMVSGGICHPPLCSKTHNVQP